MTAQTPVSGQTALAIENELKYVLAIDFNAESLVGWKRSVIRQAYLQPKPYPRRREQDFLNGNIEYTTNLKVWSDEIKADWEDEKPTSKADFDQHWRDTDSKNKLQKTRYEKEIGDEKWCVDFLHDPKKGTYFVMAEVEMPEGREKPKTFPLELGRSVTFAVPKGNREFSSRKLSDPDYAEEKLKEIKNRPRLKVG